MSQNITIMGASYTGVPAVTLPKTGGGTATFTDVTDTTAAAADVASGKLFYDASGILTTGTSSGGEASNVVQGRIWTAARGQIRTVTLDYSGSGYPIACLVFIEGGAYNNTSSGNTDWYNSTNRYDCGWYAMVKSRVTEAPTYTSSGAVNYGTVAVIYKNSTSTATSYTRTSSMTVNTFTSSSTNPTYSTGMVRFKGNGKTMSLYSGNATSTTIGFPPETYMTYIVVYSE